MNWISIIVTVMISNSMKTILFIDDNKAILENLTEFMEIKGYTVLGADNGKRGFELAKEFVPDLIICDVLMHEMTGYDVLRSILEDGTTNKIPFIFSTSMSEKVDRAESLELGADDYITKPYELETLLKLVQRWIATGKLPFLPLIPANSIIRANPR